MKFRRFLPQGISLYLTYHFVSHDVRIAFWLRMERQASRVCFYWYCQVVNGLHVKIQVPLFPAILQNRKSDMTGTHG